MTRMLPASSRTRTMRIAAIAPPFLPLGSAGAEGSLGAVGSVGVVGSTGAVPETSAPHTSQAPS